MNQEKMSTSPSEELPTPVGHKGDGFNEAQLAKEVEAGAVSSRTSSHATPTQATHTPSSSQATPGVTPQSSSSQPHQIATPQIADDEDLIEKEWVESAKRIVAQTKGDPHAQSDNLNAVKEDYLKKRFNIDNDLGKVS